MVLSKTHRKVITSDSNLKRNITFLMEIYKNTMILIGVSTSRPRLVLLFVKHLIFEAFSTQTHHDTINGEESTEQLKPSPALQLLTKSFSCSATASVRPLHAGLCGVLLGRLN